VLLEEVQTSELPADLKLFALRHLSAIMRALAEFRIRGMDGLREALVVAGAAFMSDKRFHEAADKTGVWERIIGFLSGAGKAVDSAAQIGKGTADILELMTGGGGS
jgi:hypothetical protein